ncbi:DUF2500 domain-containing protein [Kineosporia babensis]|uniref:DUF2500 domain-containing protein n=1 Tax=Kineosporia babensis TaxID=499548 RepID=A0A9X1STM7_9ACTN|nr:DUF2500 domain-containing protein [Kineosporia babensis]MCD5312084.1 DUF2500 domain-containing protein [Kineosporia babensis]
MTTTLGLIGFLILTNAVFGYILFGITPGTIRQRLRDNGRPKEELPSQLVAKRHEVHLQHGEGDPWHHTRYFAAFQVSGRSSWVSNVLLPIPRRASGVSPGSYRVGTAGRGRSRGAAVSGLPLSRVPA